MPTRMIQFFCTIKEATEFLSAIEHTQKRVLYLYKSNPRPEVRLAKLSRLQDNLKEFEAGRIFISAVHTDIDALDATCLAPAPLGWVQFDLPKVNDGQLFIGTLSAKSDWLNPMTKKVEEFPNVLELFKAVAKEFKRCLSFPVWAWDVNTRKSNSYTTIGFTSGAKEFVEQGGQLRQEGVENVMFGVTAPGNLGNLRVREH